ncbi:major histocompatibility complex class I-related gene protein-like [Parambassis ranga]|uniref:Major histocompatibility complex class I-related gene protein-like n=1 Tax=Parambassis ranga TaxID=210632 RepID=A0A6P7HT43_9TELE|nr:major histocompatibility complex class I-related gene protein-like [Parambassis ranga]
MLMRLLLFCQAACAVKHSLRFLLTGASGILDFPQFMGCVEVDGILAGYCDSKTRSVQPRQDWVRKLFSNIPEHLAFYNHICSSDSSNFNAANVLDQNFNQTEGTACFTQGCEWDETTGEITCFVQYGYNGDDFISLDLKTLTWIAQKPQALITKVKWDARAERTKYIKRLLTQMSPALLKEYVMYGRSSLQRTDLPSVSLLQKTPSSAVSCHATGFYPDRALMFWSKDGEEIHEGVEHREILPNHDGSFQMTVDLNVSSVPEEDWRRYHCVFQLDGAKERVVTKVDKTLIRTNKT